MSKLDKLFLTGLLLFGMSLFGKVTDVGGVIGLILMLGGCLHD